MMTEQLGSQTMIFTARGKNPLKKNGGEKQVDCIFSRPVTVMHFQRAERFVAEADHLFVKA